MKSISNLLKSKLVKKARELDKLGQLVHACVPENCRQHIKVAGIKENSLVLITDTPVWSSRIRLYTNDILTMLKQHQLANVEAIKIRLSPAGSIEPEKVAKKRFLDEDSSRLIQQTAESIDDPALKQALHKLASNKKTNQKND